jgi:uncharacterized membrane protein YoaK (UPF0700 family)
MDYSRISATLNPRSLMFHHRIDKDTPLSVIGHWLLLSFMAGNINSGGLIACGRFVSNVTGFYTLAGESAAHLSWDAAIGFLSIPFFFLAGVMISAVLVERPMHMEKKPHYVWVMGLITILLVASTVFGMIGSFGTFGDNHLKIDYTLLALLSLSSGLLNAAISVASGHSVRVTHMTGNTTDLGIGIVRLRALKKKTSGYENEMRAVLLRLGIIVSFTLGSGISGYVLLQVHYLGFLVPASIAFYSAVRESLSGTGIMMSLPRILQWSKGETPADDA